MDELNVSEKEISLRLGITRDTLKEIRNKVLKEGDYGIVGRTIRYSEEGVEKIKNALQKTAPEGAKIGDIAPLKIENSEVVDAMVVQVFNTNRHFLAALMGEQTVAVRVKSNKNFVVDMVIPGQHLRRGTDTKHFDFVGRCPRSKGRW